MTAINHPQATAEVAAAFDAYEAALVANDVPALQAFFWRSPHAVRFGATEQLYGYEQIADFRSQRVVNCTSRRPLRRSIVTFGTNFASVMYEYAAEIEGLERRGRQSQTWAKLDNAWRIVSAHVSLAPAEPDLPSYVSQALAASQLAPDPAWMPRIQQLFANTSALAQPLLDFPLPPETEPAPVFTP